MYAISYSGKMVIEKLRTGEEEGGGDETVELCVAFGGGGGGVEDHTSPITPPLIQQPQQCLQEKNQICHTSTQGQ